ncbi:hypothetical protein C2S53_002617 [Perilla frutescens var. hirtella]|uniref:Ty3 transposon capsid-like protein domain-containing protein n=1 Tax=Perilla frutescens var. hirtella TaxID=608512 RepID=A0AAD4ISG3_PERFH|nr:hypothetical protein C2S53_002617 [Perilla frutescens var. hirtella]
MVVTILKLKKTPLLIIIYSYTTDSFNNDHTLDASDPIIGVSNPFPNPINSSTPHIIPSAHDSSHLPSSQEQSPISKLKIEPCGNEVNRSGSISITEHMRHYEKEMGREVKANGGVDKKGGSFGFGSEAPFYDSTSRSTSISRVGCSQTNQLKKKTKNHRDLAEAIATSIQSHHSSDMAENTRIKDLQEGQRQLDQLWQEEMVRREAESLKRDAAEEKFKTQMTSMATMQEGMMGKLEHLTGLVASMSIQLRKDDKGKDKADGDSILGSPPHSLTEGNSQTRTSYSVRDRQLVNHQEGSVYTPLPKVEFPKFDGSYPRVWILKCKGYFKMVPNIPDDQKIALTSMNLEGKAAVWFQSNSSKHADLTWPQFLDLISARFEDLKEDNIVAEFNKLRHTGSYTDYVEKFEELREYMRLFDSRTYSETYFIASFLSGLSEELKSAVRMFNPSTLEQAIELGKHQLTTIEALTKKLKGSARPYSSGWSTPHTKASTQSIPYQSQPPTATPTQHPKTPEEEGLSYISLMEPTAAIADSDTPTEEVSVSLNDLKGDTSITTLRFTGSCQGHQLHILVDTGSTLSFIKDSTAHKLGCEIEEATPLCIKVANGQRLTSSAQAGSFEWELQGQTLQHSLRLLQLEGCDIILGGDWLKACSPIELDYEKMTVAIHCKGRKIKLLAHKSQPECQMISHHTLYKMMHSQATHEIEEVYLVANQTLTQSENPKLQKLLEEFEMIFQEPQGLPPTRRVEHQIYLKPGSEPRHQFPYSWIQEVTDSYTEDAYFSKLKNSLLQDPSSYPHYYVAGDVIKYKGRITVGRNEGLRLKLLNAMYRKVLQELPEINDNGVFRIFPCAALDSRTITREAAIVPQLLIRWEASEDSNLLSWEDEKFVRKKFPSFDPCGQGSFVGGANVVHRAGLLGEEHAKDGEVMGLVGEMEAGDEIEAETVKEEKDCIFRVSP